MTTGVQCKVHPDCRQPAPAGTRICYGHRRLIRLAAMRRSPSASVRVLGWVLVQLADREAGG